MRTIREWKTLAVLTAIAAMAVAGCGGGGGTTSATTAAGGAGGSTGSSNEPVTLNVGVIPIVDVAPLYVGIAQGFFKDQNLTIKPHLAQGGAAIIPAVQSGDFQIGFSNVISEIIATSQGLPIQIITQGVQGGTNANNDYSALLVKGDSSIKTPKDIEGKTVATNTLKNICSVTINASLQKKGVDTSKIKYVEMEFPDMPAALEKGQVDAMCGIEPFVTAVEDQGGRNIDSFYAGTAPHLTVATYFTTKQYIAENPDVVKRFQTAMNKSLVYSQAHPDAVKKAVLTYTKVPKAAVEKIKLPYWSDDLNTKSITQLIDYSSKYGLITKKPALSDMIYQGQ